MTRDPLQGDDHEPSQSDSLNDSAPETSARRPPQPLPARLAEFERVYREQFGTVASYFARRSLDPQLVADLVAETFVAALRSFDDHDAAHGSPRAWMLGLSRRVHSRYRESDPRGEELARSRSLSQILDARETEELIWWIDLEASSRELITRLSRMSAMDREAFELVDICGLSTAEAARVMGISAGALRVRVLRTRTRLRREAGGHV